MYEPSIRLTEKLLDHLREIDDVRSLLKTIPILPIVEEPIKKEALVETVHYTTRIEGNPLDMRAVEKLGAEYSLTAKIGSDEQEIVNLYKAMELVRYLAPKRDIPINEDVIRQLHATIVRDVPKSEPAGVYRVGQNAVKDENTDEQIFMPPGPFDVPQLMNEFTQWLSRQQPIALHPVIMAGMAHLELVAIHPFDDGNGRTARALADLVLYRHGYALRYMFSWIAQAGADVSNYHKTLRQVLGPEYGANVDPTLWLEYFAKSVSKSLSTRRSRLETIRDAFVGAYNAGEAQGWSTDQVEALVFAALNGYVTTGDYVRARKLSRSTAVKRLNQLVTDGFLHPDGKGRNARYKPKGSLEPDVSSRKSEGEQLGLE